MADIKKYLDDIAKAERGEDVRWSIHDGIQAINDESTKSNEAVETLVQASESGKLSGTIEIGTVETGNPGTPAEVTNVGTPKDAILNFVIPSGKNFRLRGEWLAGEEYTNDESTIDLVAYNDSTYACRISHTSSSLLTPDDKSYWQLFVQGNAVVDFSKFVTKEGDSMSGPLSVPTLILGSTPSEEIGAMWID